MNISPADSALPGKQKISDWDLFKPWSKAFLLIGLGLYLSYIIFTGLLNNYINTRFIWLSYIAAFLFLLIGAISLFKLLSSQSSQVRLQNHSSSSSWFAILVVTIPLLLGLLIPSSPLGASAVAGNLSTGSTGATSWTVADIPSTQRNVLDWLRLISLTSDLNQLVGQEADVIGFVYSEATYDEKSFMLVRFTISCCVADASAIGLPVILSETNNLEQGLWVRVQAITELATFNNEEQLVLRATSVEEIEAPANPYLYP